MYHNVNAKKLQAFLNVLKGFGDSLSIVEMLGQAGLSASRSPSLRQMSKVASVEASNDGFPDISEELDFFNTAFDHEMAKKNGFITPQPGLDLEYDAATESIAAIEKRLEDYLKEQQKHFR